jgi:hypothetical protein
MSISTRRSVGTVVLVLTLALVTAACGSVGSAGTLAPRSPDGRTLAPSIPPASEPVASPEPSDEPSQAPSDEPSQPGTTPAPVATPTPSPTRAPRPSPSPTPAGATAVKIYLFIDGALVPVHRSIDATRAVGRAAISELLEGPTGSEADFGVTTSVPDGTILLGLDIADGLATVDLSREFESGGGSASMFGRLAQVVYTLTQFPTVERVAFRLDGQPVTVFSGEGIVLDGPSVRTDYESFLPSIFIDRPALGATVANPVRISGLANVFEASFFVEILDEDGIRLAREHVMATCGTGCWGTFDVTIPYDVSSRQAGSIVTYILSAQDGEIDELRVYPVTLVP